MSWYSDIGDFHRKFRLTYEGLPRVLPIELQAFRTDFLYEEIEELRQSTTRADELDALIDFMYVLLGSAYLHGIDVRQSTISLSALMPKAWSVQNVANKPAVVKDLIHMVRVYELNANNTVGLIISVSMIHKLLDYVTWICVKNHLPFNAAWDLVHRANMNKVRAESPLDSKRGSTYDVVKPQGWIAPDLKTLVGE